VARLVDGRVTHECKKPGIRPGFLLRYALGLQLGSNRPPSAARQEPGVAP